MSPKEKADELYWDFDASTQYALRAVYEILNAIGEIFETFEERKYWEEVKTEIQKL